MEYKTFGPIVWTLLAYLTTIAKMAFLIFFLVLRDLMDLQTKKDCERNEALVSQCRFHVGSPKLCPACDKRNALAYKRTAPNVMAHQ